jgi:predicted nucleic acid-binding protein
MCKAVWKNTASQVWRETLDLAASRKLTVYDANYLEPALRLRLPLASLDQALRQASRPRRMGTAVAIMPATAGSGSLQADTQSVRTA